MFFDTAFRTLIIRFQQYLYLKYTFFLFTGIMNPSAKEFVLPEHKNDNTNMISGNFLVQPFPVLGSVYPLLRISSGLKSITNEFLQVGGPLFHSAKEQMNAFISLKVPFLFVAKGMFSLTFRLVCRF